MSQDYPECEYVSESGREILGGSAVLREKLAAFWQDPEPERILGGRYLGVGKYSIVREIDGIAVKVSSPTSSKEAYETGGATVAENLAAQFVFLQIFGDFLAARRADIVVPRQYFVAHSPHDCYMLGQECMRGWVALEEWAGAHFEKGNTAFNVFALTLKTRIKAVVEGTHFLHYLNDLRLEDTSIHSGNILVPRDADPDSDMPLCILDQPLRSDADEGVIRRMRQRLERG